MTKVEAFYNSLKHSTNTREIVQISDPHLFADGEATLLGVNTRDSFLATLESIQIQHPNPDLIVVTGDISQDFSPDSYKFFAKSMVCFDCPILCLAGNHDEVEAIEAYVVNEQIHTQKSFQLNEWNIVMAHSQVKGKVYGLVCDDELQWLEQELSQNSINTIIFTHHHPVFSNTEWIDVIGIKNCEEFTELLAKYDHVKACGFGHIHQNISVKQDHIDYYSVPSTCIQFKKNSKEFAVSEELPGYRVFHCYPDGKLETQVFRVENFELTLDKTATGY